MSVDSCVEVILLDLRVKIKQEQHSCTYCSQICWDLPCLEAQPKLITSWLLFFPMFNLIMLALLFDLSKCLLQNEPFSSLVSLNCWSRRMLLISYFRTNVRSCGVRGHYIKLKVQKRIVSHHQMTSRAIQQQQPSLGWIYMPGRSPRIAYTCSINK